MSEIHTALLGFGNVGRSFARYVSGVGDGEAVKVRIRAVADSSGGLLLGDDAKIDDVIACKESGAGLKGVARGRLIKDPRDFIASLPAAGVSAVIESLPTNLNDGQPALDLLLLALSKGINAVTVDKGPLVHGFDELKDASRAGQAQLGYSGTTGVSPPAEVAGKRVIEIRGVLNGTTNYILTEMQARDLSFEQALAETQAAGIAEPDPSLDIGGWDTAAKILILAKAAMGADCRLADVSRTGLGPQTAALIEVARKRGGILRLVGRARVWQGRVRVSVAPKIIEPGSPFYSVSGTSKAAVFRVEGRGEVVSFARSGRDAISRTILDDLKGFRRQDSGFREDYRIRLFPES